MASIAQTIMGFDIVRFVGEVDEELLCPICTGVLQDPVQVKTNFNLHMLIIIIILNAQCNWIETDCVTFFFFK